MSTGKGRLEAFSDGVITIMVLELKVPHGPTLEALHPLWLIPDRRIEHVLQQGPDR